MVKDVRVEQLKTRLDAGDDFVLLDVREADEREFASIGGTFIPLSEFGTRYKELDPEKEVIVYCHHGGRSYSAGSYLVEKGFKNVSNLTGGIDAWSVKIDKAVKRY